MAPPSQAPRPGSEAERLFVEHVVRGEGPVDIEPLCQAHPALEGELRELHRRWVGAVHGTSLIDRLRTRHGRDGSLDVALDPPERPATDEDAARPGSAAAGPSSSVYGRLSSRGGGPDRYRHEGEIARGGMGAILRVWDEDLRRTLAMKVALTRSEPGAPDSAAAAADSRLLARFLEEAQITGQLDHPGVVPVHELGLDAEGRVYFTMRLVKGRDLKAVFDLVRRGEEGWTRTRALGVLLKVCEAMAFAHEKGVIHRDLKPANIMVGRFGETYVMDWGLARVLGREDTHDVHLRADASLSVVRTDRAEDRKGSSPLETVDGDIIGTPCYMPPEQARGRLEDIGPHSDVYAAGALLYHLLTGRMPYAGDDESTSPHVVLRGLLDGPPQPIQAVDRSVPDELVAISEKAMAREPRERYATMLAMAEDLRAYLEDRVVRAHATGPVAEFKKWIRRNRATAVAGAVAAAATLVGLVTTVLVQARANEKLSAAKAQTEEARDEALDAQRDLEVANVDLAAARDEADTEARQARMSEYAANVAAASASLRLADAADARRRLALCAQEQRGWEWRHLELAADSSVRDLGDADSARAALAFHPDGELVAATVADGALELLRTTDGSLVRRIETGEGQPHVVAFTPDGSRLACLHSDRAIHLWDVATGTEVRSFGLHRGAITDLAFAPDGSSVATASNDKRVRLWDVATGKLLHTLEGHRSGVTSVAFGRAGALLASGSRDRTVRVWDVASGAPLRVLEGSEYPLAFVAFDPAGLRVAGGSRAYEGQSTETVARGANTVRLWDVDEGSLLGVFSGPRQRITTGGISPDGRWLMAASTDSTIWMWDLQTGRDQVLLGHAAGILDAVFSPDGTQLVTSAGDRTVKLWNPRLRLGFSLRGHSGAVTAARFAAQGELLVTASADATLRAWSARSGLIETVFRGHLSRVLDLAVHPDEELVASSAADGTVRLWDVASGREVARIGTEQAPGPGTIASMVVQQLDFQPSGRLLAIAGSDGEVALWDVERRELARTLTGGEDGFSVAVRWTPDGERLLVLRTRLDPLGSTLELYDVASGERVAHRATPRTADIAFSPDGLWLAATTGRRISLLDPRTLADGRELLGHEARIDTLVFSPDGRRLGSAASGDPIRIWDLASGETLLALAAPGGEVAELAFSSGGSQLAAACSDWSAQVWSTAPAADRETAQGEELARRREVLDLLDGLFEAFGDVEVVIDRLRADPGLEAERLHTALRLARLVAPDPRAADLEAWRVLRVPGEAEEDLHVAYWSACVATALETEDERTQLLLGAAHYRLGHLSEALTALERADALRRTRGRVEVLALLAMVRHRLGDAADSHKAFAELTALMQIPVVLVQRENQALFLEAETVRNLPP